MIELKLITYCDAANIRDQLLSVLGGGITALNHESYPAPLGISLAMIFELSDVPLDGATHQVIAICRHDAGGEPVFTTTADFQVLPGQGDRSGVQSVPLVADLSNVGLDAPGPFTTEVLVDGNLVGNLRFTARVVNATYTVEHQVIEEDG